MSATHSAVVVLDPFGRLVGHAPAANAKQVLAHIQPLINIHWSGFYKIAGTLNIDDTPTDVPVARKLILFAEPMMIRVASAWSDAAGIYSFEKIRGDYKYTVLALDYEHNYRAVVADNLTPDPM